MKPQGAVCSFRTRSKGTGRKQFLESRKGKSCKKTILREDGTYDGGRSQPEVTPGGGSQGNKYPLLTHFLPSNFLLVLPFGQIQLKATGREAH